jgi:predicted nucleic acid-binding protein
MEAADEDRIFISVVSFAELHDGAERMAAGRRRSRLEPWLQHELALRFESRILPVDTKVAEAWGKTVLPSEASDRRDGCLPGGHSGTHQRTLVTRNLADFSSAQSGSRSLGLKTAITSAFRPPQRPRSSPG